MTGRRGSEEPQDANVAHKIGGGGRYLFPALTLALLAILTLAALATRAAEAQDAVTARYGPITSGEEEDNFNRWADSVSWLISFRACTGSESCTDWGNTANNGNWMTNVGIKIGLDGYVSYDGTPIDAGPIRISVSNGDWILISVNQPSSPSAPTSSGPTIHRSSPLTAIADSGPTEWWFPVGRGQCAMKDEQRPWTWKRWRAPTADRCGWLSLPEGSRRHFDEPVDELAFAVYTALVASPDLSGQAATKAPSGRKVKLEVWGVYPHPERTTNSTSRFKGPYTTPLTVCLPGAEDQVIAAYDPEQRGWAQLESVEAQHEGHVCGLLSHDLGLLAVTTAGSN